MTDPADGPATLTDDEIETHRFDSAVTASTDDAADTADTADDATDDATDTGDDATDTSDDAADTSDTGDGS